MKSNTSTGRSYEYDTKYESSPLQKKRRAARNAARREAIRDGKVKKGDGKDIDHINRNLGGNLNNSPSNTRVQSRSRNRGRNSPKGSR
jgi:hypothetical protein